jgi:hypothetical protein
MQFDLNRSLEILERTPLILESMLGWLSEDWVMNNEGADTWSPFDVVGHLIHGETTDWITRMDIILSGAADRTFKPFDRFAQFRESEGKTMQQLLDEFKRARKHNTELLRSKNLTEADLQLTGIHPSFGQVTLQNLLATWVVHDLDHIMQIARVMAKQYRSEVGPWVEYLKILKMS